MAIQSFHDVGTADLFNRKSSRAARKACPVDLWSVARRKLDQLNAAVSLPSLAIPPGNRLEAHRGDPPGQHSIRINERWRACFRWTDAGPVDVEVVDYH
jgi:toxin HigB-1